MKIIAMTLGLLSACVLGAMALVWTPLLIPMTRWIVRSQLPAVQFDTIVVEGFLSVQLSNVRVVDVDGLACAHVGNAILSVRPFSLLDGRIHITNAVLSDVDVQVRSGSDGRLCLLNIWPGWESDSSGSSIDSTSTIFPLAVVADHIEIDGARVLIGHGAWTDAWSASPLQMMVERTVLSGGFSQPVAYATFDAIDAILLIGDEKLRVGIDGHALWVIPTLHGDAQLHVRVERAEAVAKASLDGFVRDGILYSNSAIALQGMGELALSSALDLASTLHAEAWVRTRSLDLSRFGVNALLSMQGAVQLHGVPLSRSSKSRTALDFRGSSVDGRVLEDGRLSLLTAGDTWSVIDARLRAQGAKARVTAHGTVQTVHAQAQASFSGRIPFAAVDASLGRLDLTLRADVDAHTQCLSLSGVIEQAQWPGKGSISHVALHATADASQGRNAHFAAHIDAKSVALVGVPGVTASILIDAQRAGAQLSASGFVVATKSGARPVEASASVKADALLGNRFSFVPTGVDRLLSTVRAVAEVRTREFTLTGGLPVDARMQVTLGETLAIDAGLFMRGAAPRQAVRITAETPRSALRMSSRTVSVQPIQAEITSTDFPLTSLHQVIPDFPDVDGVATARVTLAGTLSAMQVRASLDGKQVRIASVLARSLLVTAQASLVDLLTPNAHTLIKVGVARADVAGMSAGGLDLGAIGLDAELTEGHGIARLTGRSGKGAEWLQADASVAGIPGADATIDATAALVDFDLSVLQSLLADLQVKGSLSLSAKATGRLLAPSFTGEARIDDGAVTYRAFPGLQGVALHARLSGQHLVVDRLSARGQDARGSLQGTADVGFALGKPQSATARVAFDDFMFSYLLVRDALLTTLVKADVSFAGGISGNVVVSEGSLQVGTLGGGDRPLASIGDPPDVQFVTFDALGHMSSSEARARATNAISPLNLTLHANNVNVRNAKNTLQVSADLRLANSEDGIVPAGSVSVSSGRVEVLSRTYDVARARITLAGDALVDPALDVRIERQFPRAKVSVEVHGTVSKPGLTLASSPAIYDRAQLLALVISGKEEATSSGSGPARSPQATREQLASTVASALLGPLATTLGKAVGLDIVRLGVDRSVSGRKGILGDSRASLELGKFITDRLYVGARGVLGASDVENSYEARLEYGLTERLRLESSFGDRGVGGLDLMWRYLY